LVNGCCTGGRHRGQVRHLVVRVRVAALERGANPTTSEFTTTYNHRNLDLEHACRKKRANFFQPVSTLFCEVKRSFVEPCKNV
jgi:hypothetical protein